MNTSHSSSNFSASKFRKRGSVKLLRSQYFKRRVKRREKKEVTDLDEMPFKEVITGEKDVFG